MLPPSGASPAQHWVEYDVDTANSTFMLRNETGGCLARRVEAFADVNATEIVDCFSNRSSWRGRWYRHLLNERGPGLVYYQIRNSETAQVLAPFGLCFTGNCPPPSAGLHSDSLYRQMVSSGGLPADWFQWFMFRT